MRLNGQPPNNIIQRTSFRNAADAERPKDRKNEQASPIVLG
jgi:hypothetical protein